MRRLVAEHRAVLGPAAVRDGTPRPIDVRPATYSYLELHDWRARAQELVWSFSDVVALDLDEFRNRITILLNTGIDEAAIRSRFDVVGVPDGMLSFQVTGPAVPGNHLTVDSTIRPLRGGTQINTSAFGCTYGFNAKLGSSNVLLTNSHCTPTLFGFDGTPVYQTGFPAIGSEWLDPASECVVYPPWFHPCRDSDAAVFLHSSSDFDVGRIVRTTFRVHGGGVYGSLVIDDANPYFQIVGEYSSPPVGAIVNKIGQTSGWTHGLVRYTCMDVTLTHPVIPTYRIKCATNATYTSASGDSGSPVFTWDPGSATVLLTCMNFGHMGDGTGLYSPLALIESEVGNLTVVASGGGGSPPPVQVTIQGPTQVPPSAAEGCAWGANVSGGTWPYSYQWEWDGQVVSTDEFYVPSGGLQSGAHWLTVTVWDATGSDWDGLSVDVHSSYSCF